MRSATASVGASGVATLAVALAMLAAAPAAAQAPAEPSASPGPVPSPTTPEAGSDPADAGGLEDIVVTARRRVESAQNIPVAITALSGEQLQRYDLTNIDKIAALTPQFQVGRSAVGSGAQLTLRGIGSNSSSIGIEQSVAVIVDGVYYGNGRVISEGFFDLSRFELLKGPQALFFGKNATAGVISITTASPTDTWENSSRIGYEVKAEQVYGEQVISGPLTPTLGIRAAVRISHMFGGYTDGLATDQPFTTTDRAGGTRSYVAPPAPKDQPQEREYVGRLTLAWEPSSQLSASLKLSGTINRNNNPAWNNIIFSCPGGFSQVQPTVRCRRDWFTYHNDIPPEIAGPFPLTKDGELETDYKSWSATGTINYNLDNLALTAVLNYHRQDNRFVGDSDYQQRVQQIWVTDRSIFRNLSGEFRAVSSFDGPFNFLAGLYLQDTRRTVDQNVFAGNVEDSRLPAERRYIAFGKESFTDGRTASPYVQATLKLIDTVEVAGGVRYTHETKDSQFVHDTALATNYVVGVPVVADQTFNNWSPEATVTWRVRPNVTLYGAYKTAYKSGGFSNSSALLVTSRPQDLSFGPEKARGFETGLKATVLDNQLRFDLTAYTFLYKDLQIDFFNGQTFAFITTNAGSARTKGVEFQAEFAPRALPGFSLRGSINYNRARYRDFLAPCYVGQSIAAGCNTVAFGGLGQDLSGTPTSVAPKWTASLGGNYDVDVGTNRRFGVSVDTRYSSSYIGSPFGNPFTDQPKYVNLDASIRYGDADGRWQLALIGKNLTNQFWITGALDASGTGFGTGTNTARPSDQRGFSNIPRTVQAQLTFRY